jgi:hypothetical protein
MIRIAFCGLNIKHDCFFPDGFQNLGNSGRDQVTFETYLLAWKKGTWLNFFNVRTNEMINLVLRHMLYCVNNFRSA